jgi:hypothetical protein
MSINASGLSQYVVEPTLDYVQEPSTVAKILLLTIAEQASALDPCERDKGFGLYQMHSTLHRQCWDGFLAFQPDLASKVRGLASQQAFLNNPDDELCTNLAYATAMVWVYLKMIACQWPSTDDPQAIAAICSRYFQDNELGLKQVA